MNHDGPAPRGSVLDPVGLLVGLVLPLVLLGGIAAYVTANLDALPREYPSHWGADGEPDGWSDPVSALAPPLVVALLVAVPMTGAAAFARVDRFMRQMLLMIGLGVVALFAVLTADPLIRILDGEQDPAINGPAAALAVAVALLIGGFGAAGLRDGRPHSAAEQVPSAELPRAPLQDEQLVLPPPRWHRWLLVGVVIGSGAVMLIFSLAMGLAITLLLAPALFLCLPYRINVGAAGLEIRLAWSQVQRVGAGEIVGARTEELAPWKYGGAGYRFTGGGVAVVTGKGPGVRVDIANGRHLLFSCPDPETAQRLAGVLNAAADRSRRGD